MNNLHHQLEKTTLKPLTAVESHHVWERISQRKTTPSLFIIFFSKHMTALLLVLVLVLGGGGIVAASDNAAPGDTLYKIDLATERARLALAGETKKQALAVAFANERLVEVQKLRGDGSVDDDSNDKSANGESVTEIEADIFINETVIKLEINDQKYGFTTEARTREAIVAQIAGKYNLDKDFVDAQIVIENENRASRAQDKDFITGTAPVVLTEKQKRDIDTSFTQSIAGLGDDNAELVAALAALMQSADDGKLKFEQNGQEIEIESEDGVIKIKVDNDDENDSEDDNDQSGDDNHSGNDDRDDTSTQSDDSQNSDDDRDNSGRGSDDDKEDDKNDDSSDDNKDNDKDTKDGTDDSKDDDSDRR